MKNIKKSILKRKDFLVEKMIELIFLGGIFFMITHFAQKSYTNYTIDRENAGQLFAEFTELSNKRLYRTKRLFDVYMTPDTLDSYFSHRVKKYRDEYWDIKDEWNSKLSKNHLLIEMRFGNKFKKRFDTDVHSGFIKLNNNIYRISKKYLQPDVNLTAKDSLDFINYYQEFTVVLDAYYSDMKTAIIQGEIGKSKRN